MFSDHDELDESLNHIPQSMEFQTLSIKKSDDPMNEDESSIYHSLSNKTDRVINDHSPSNNGDISAGNQSENRTNTDDENLEDISNSPQLVDDSAPHTRDDILSGDFMNVVNPVSNLHDEIIDHDDTPKGSLKITSQNGFHVQNENDAIFAENSFNGIHANDHVDDSIEELNEEIEYVADSIGSNFDGGVECDGVIEQIEIMQQDVGDEDREGSSEPIDTVMAQEKVNYENVPEPMDTVMIEENNNQENVVISEPIDGGNDLLNADATTQPAELMNVDESLVIPNELKNDELQDGKPTFYLAEDSIDSKLEKSNDTREMETNEFVPVDDEMLNANIDYSLKITKSHQSEIAEESRDNSILPDERSPENEKLLPTVKKSSKKSRKSDTQIPEILKSSKKVKLEESIEVDQPTKVAKPKKNRLAKDLKSDIKEDALFSNIDDASKKSDVDIPSSDSKSKSTISNDNQASNSKKPHVIKSSNILDESPPQDDRNAPRPALKTFKRSSRKSKKNEQQVEIVEEELNEGKKSKFEVLVEPISSKRSKSTKTNISEIALDTPYIVVADTSKRASRSRKDDALKLEPKTDEKSNDKANSSPIAPRKIEEVVPIPRRSLNKNALVDLFEKRLPEEIAPAPKKSSKKSLTPIASRSSEPTYRITFTGILSTELPKKSQILVKYGASIVDNWVDCTHLVSDKVRRTTKFLCALSCGKHIMDLKWTEACKKQGKILEETKYILNDPASEELYGFKLTESLELARQNGTVLFKGITVYTTPSVQPKRDDLKEIIDAAGGSVFLFNLAH